MSRSGTLATLSSVASSVALAVVPLIGLVELALYFKQTKHDVVPDADWVAAREVVAKSFEPSDLVLFSPFWADPIGRRAFGDTLAPRKHEARPDESRFARVFEVSIRGEHRPELEAFRKVSEQRVGGITIGTYENPAPVRVITDLLDLANASPPSHLAVAIASNEGETPCTFSHGAGQPGGLAVPQGPAVPGDKFVCAGGGYVGTAVLHALDHHPHLCIFASVPGGSSTLRLRFRDVAFGASLHGHSGVQWVTERNASGERIALSFEAQDRSLGHHFHTTGAGWTRFEFPTPELAGKRADLTVEVNGPRAERQFCFEADTRTPAPDAAHE